MAGNKARRQKRASRVARQNLNAKTPVRNARAERVARAVASDIVHHSDAAAAKALLASSSGSNAAASGSLLGSAAAKRAAAARNSAGRDTMDAEMSDGGHRNSSSNSNSANARGLQTLSSQKKKRSRVEVDDDVLDESSWKRRQKEVTLTGFSAPTFVMQDQGQQGPGSAMQQPAQIGKLSKDLLESLEEAHVIREAEIAQARRQREIKRLGTGQRRKTAGNAFAALMDSDDEEDEVNKPSGLFFAPSTLVLDSDHNVEPIFGKKKSGSQKKPVTQKLTPMAQSSFSSQTWTKNVSANQTKHDNISNKKKSSVVPNVEDEIDDLL